MRAALLTGPIIPPAAMRVPPIAKGSPVDLWLRVEKRQTLHSPGRSSPGGPDNSIQSLELSGPLSVMKQLHACVHVCMIVDSSQRLVSDPPPPPGKGGEVKGSRPGTQAVETQPDGGQAASRLPQRPRSPVPRPPPGRLHDRSPCSLPAVRGVLLVAGHLAPSSLWAPRLAQDRGCYQGCRHLRSTRAASGANP